MHTQRKVQNEDKEHRDSLHAKIGFPNDFTDVAWI